MSKKDIIENTAWELLVPICNESGYIPVDVEYIKNNKEYMLNIYVDKEGGISIDDCEIISRRIEKELDEIDLISDPYTLIVSSPGLGRPIKRPRDYDYAKGKEVDITTFSKINDSKEFMGILVSFDDDSVEILTDDKKMMIEKKLISSMKIAFDF